MQRITSDNAAVNSMLDNRWVASEPPIVRLSTYRGTTLYTRHYMAGDSSSVMVVPRAFLRSVPIAPRPSNATVRRKM